MSDSSSILVFALQIASSFIVILLVLVIIVFRVVRYKIKPHNKNNWSTHVFKVHVTSQYQVHTYSEIDEKNTRGTEFNIPIELRNYELIEQLQDAYAAKYTELPAKNTAEMPE